MIDFLLGFEQHLPGFIEAYGMWVYALLFMIIFAETAFIAMFFLPGDSLLLSVGALCASVDFMHLDFMIMLLFAAATLGYIVNYHTGKFFGPQITSVKSRFIKPEHLTRTNRYFVRHGGKTILMARFIPFVRSVAPFAAGANQMNYPMFLLYNLLGGLFWIGLLLGLGYFAGSTIFLINEII
ncbi:VTT domain-containing protein [Acinetobacter radioresistens]|uniref:VTT domain-containing protein n=1 Tax=Acinetobacter radioresistens TaxID=40216 RepID=UPI00028EFEF9|nr:VTT domain-containing protein [Acinetobacter radioresistens]BBL21977.1 cytochrome o ubiquinol oxidase [Acinetobacter radioresistens DSM 6976 = NBRC 102413 = CIP 103788]